MLTLTTAVSKHLSSHCRGIAAAFHSAVSFLSGRIELLLLLAVLVPINPARVWAIQVFPTTMPPARPEPTDLFPAVDLVWSDGDLELLDGNTNQGTGTVIVSQGVPANQSAVLTAAHVICVKGENRVLPFHWFRRYDATGGLIGQPIAGLAIRHPLYIPGSGYSLADFDLGLVLLESEVPDVTPMILAVSPPELGAEVAIVGNGNGNKVIATITRQGFSVVGEPSSLDKQRLLPQRSGEGLGHIVEGADSGGPAVVIVDGTITNQVFGVNFNHDLGGPQTWTVPVHGQTAQYDWAQGNTILNLNSVGDVGSFLLQNTIDHVLNANVADKFIRWIEGPESSETAFTKPARVALGLLNNEELILARYRQIDFEFSGPAHGTGGDGGVVRESLIIGESGTLNGHQGSIRVDSGTFVTSSLHNLNVVTVNGPPKNSILLHLGGPPLIEAEHVLNEGILSLKTGGMNVSANYIQSSDGTLQIGLGGSEPLENYGRLNVAGSTSLNGTLEVTLSDGYLPTDGMVFQVLTSTGGFTSLPDEIKLPTGISGGTWGVRYLPAAIELVFTTSSSLSGDYDVDGDVDVDDYVNWQRQFGTVLTAHSGADGNGDGVVNASDYIVWRNNFADPMEGHPPIVSVPEPSTFAVVVFACIVIAFRSCLGGRHPDHAA